LAKILYKGDIYSPSGYSNAIRNYIRCLLDLGHEVAIKHVQHDRIQFDPSGFDFTSKLSNFSYEDADIVIDQETPEFYEPHKNLVNIAYCVWETSRLPDNLLNWADQLNKMDIIFVPTEFNRKVFQESGVKKPIFVVPHIIDTEKFKPGKGLKIEKMTKDDVVFLACFQWTSRKNPKDLLLAYASEFSRFEPVSFILKTYASDFSLQEEERIKRLVQNALSLTNIDDRPDIYLLTKPVESEEMPFIYQTADIFVSASHGESFCLPVAEAMSCGCVPIVTGWSGQAEIITEHGYDGFLVDYILEPAEKVPGSPWYSSKQNWAKIKVIDLRKTMREVYELKKSNPQKFKEISQNARNTIVKRFSFEAVSKILDKIIKEVAN